MTDEQTHDTDNQNAQTTEQPDAGTLTSKLNWLRAAVLGANDGIVSVGAIVVGVAGASHSAGFILTAGIAGLAAGALSMAAGEYVSVSTQRDTERARLDSIRTELQSDPDGALARLANIFVQQGLREDTAKEVAREFSKKDALAAQADARYNIDPNDLNNPWQAAFASAASFLSGGIVPIIAVTLPPDYLRVPITFAAVLVALAITGSLSAQAGQAKKLRATVRVVIGGLLAMAITFGIGRVFGPATGI